MITLDIRPKTPFFTENDPLDVLVRVCCTEKPIGTRPSLNLAIVLDTSGSMRGKPLMDAKDGALHLINMLGPKDRVALLRYGSVVETLLESMPADQAKQRAAEVLARVEDNGMTALQAGWLAGASAVAPFVGRYDVSRVLLLSDGQANIGESTPGVLEGEARRLADAGIGTSTYGLGMNFNESLMTGMAVGGMAVYGETADALVPYFEQEFHVLSNTLGHGLKVRLMATSGGKGVEMEVLNRIPDEGDGSHRLGNLIAGRDSWMVVRLHTSGMSDPVVLGVDAVWSSLEGLQRLQGAYTVSRRDTAGPVDELVAERAKEASAARKQWEAREAVLRGDFRRAGLCVDAIRGMAGSNVYVAGVADSLQVFLDKGDGNAFAKEAGYGAYAMATRTMSVKEGAIGSSALDMRKVRQGLVQGKK